MPDADSHRWGYYSARMRSAIALSNHSGLEFSGYIVVGSSGGQDGGLLQRAVGLAGMGSKLIRYYNFGPEYMFPGNAYSDSPAAESLFEQIAQANSMVAQAEHVLWAARPQPAQQAILYPRSSEFWDQWHTDAATEKALCLCCCVTSMIAHYIDYTDEAYGLYLALATDSNLPVDFIDEDALEEPATLAKYKLIWVTEPDIPSAGAQGLASWVKAGGTLVTVSNAGTGDEYNEPSTVLSTLAGVTETSRQRIAVMSDTDINADQTPPLPISKGTADVTGGEALTFTAFGAVGKLSTVTKGPPHGAPITLAKFADGSPAITSNADTAAVGKGKAVHFAWLPGLSYWFSATTFVGNRPRDESTRKIIAGVARAAGVTPPALASEARVETPLLLGPDQKSAVLTVLNFKASTTVAAPPIPLLGLNVTLPFKPTKVTSVTHGALAFTATTTGAPAGSIIVATKLPLKYADFVLFESS
jgi:hypothetical protein